MSNDKGLFARKLENLFKTVLKPDGSEYSETDIEIATTEFGERVTSTYVYRLRRGLSQNPSYDKIRILANFFDISPGYFFAEDNSLPSAPEREDIPSLDLKEISLRATDVEDEATKDVLLDILTAIQEIRQTK